MCVRLGAHSRKRNARAAPMPHLVQIQMPRQPCDTDSIPDAIAPISASFPCRLTRRPLAPGAQRCPAARRRPATQGRLPWCCPSSLLALRYPPLSAAPALFSRRRRRRRPRRRRRRRRRRPPPRRLIALATASPPPPPPFPRAGGQVSCSRARPARWRPNVSATHSLPLPPPPAPSPWPPRASSSARRCSLPCRHHPGPHSCCLAVVVLRPGINNIPPVRISQPRPPRSFLPT